MLHIKKKKGTQMFAFLQRYFPLFRNGPEKYTCMQLSPEIFSITLVISLYQSKFGRHKWQRNIVGQ